MNKILALFFFLLSLTTKAQSCSQIVYPHVNSSGSGVYHVYSDSTINDQNGSEYYVCSGAHLTVNASAGNVYLMENNSQLTINNHDGDVVFAKGNCTIIDYSIEGIVVYKEASTTFSKPNMPLAGVVFLCPTMVFNYSLVGGSSPCVQTTSLYENDFKELVVYPNPIENGGTLYFNESVNSMQLFTLGGLLLFESLYLEQKYLHLPQMIPGLYLGIISLESGKNIQVKIDIR